MTYRFRIILLTLIFIFLQKNILSQYTEFHPELNWKTIKGKYVQVHYHEEAERTAFTVARIADEVWEPITSLYQYEPETVHYVIKDIDDYANGASYFFDNKIEIWSSALDFDLRGTHNWLRNVISHEFVHMVQLQASMKSSRRIPAFYLQVLNYEDERRPDILYGFPNVIASYPLATINVPAWFAEGTAQYMRREFDYERWDSHRDMILRSYVLDGNMLTWNQMGVFGKSSLGNESVYNAGYALTIYIAQKYGEDKIREISKALGSFSNFSIDAAFKDVLGKDGNEIYNEWKDFITEDYRNRISDVNTNLITGELIAEEGFGNFYPTFSPDGKKFVYLSNKSSDYFSPSVVFLYDLESGKELPLTVGVRSTIGWLPDGNKIVYSRLKDNNPNYVNVHDLYIYDISNKKENRLTNNLRANQPSVSNDGSKIVFIFQRDGTTNLGLIDIDGSNFKQLTFFQYGEQVYNPKFSNDDSFVIFDYSDHHGRDIAKVNVDASGFEVILDTDFDVRNPVFDMDGNLLYASDETGIFNLYKLNLNTNEKVRLTNVTGGAFMPGINKEGDIVYAGYTSTGYKIFKLNNSSGNIVEEKKHYIASKNPPLNQFKPNGDIDKFNINYLKNFNDKELADYEPQRYTGAFSRLSFFPFLRYDNYSTTNKALEKIKPGLYVASSDMLNRYSLFAGASINSRLERDLFLIFEYRNKLPLLFDLGIKPEMSLEVYNITREADVDILFGVDSTGGIVTYDYIIPTGVTYNLFEVDVVAKHQIFTRNQHLELRFIYSDYKATLGSFILPNIGLYPTTHDTYLIGRNFQAKYTLNALVAHRDADINPIGSQVEVQYNYEMNKFNKDSEYTVEDGILKPQYLDFNFHRIELNSKIHFPIMKGHTFTTQLRGGTILGKEVPDFFDFYLGGLIGMRSYPFYAVSGNHVAWVNVTYRFPLWRNIDARLGHLYFDKIFLSVFGDFGNAWTGNFPKFDTFKKGAGAELRLKMNSFYLFPTALFFNASYGFDSFERIVRGNPVKYGKEWRFYGGILFGFDI